LENNKNSFDLQQDEDRLSNPLKEFNVGLFVYVLNKSILWIIVLTIITIIISLVYLRYAPKIYESNATMLFSTEKKAQILGVEKISVEQDNAAINREIQLFKSRLLVERIVDSLPLEMAYFKEGKTKFISEELYNNCPFELTMDVKDPDILRVPIYINIIDEEKFSINHIYKDGEFERVYKFGQEIYSPSFKGVVRKKVQKFHKEDFRGLFYARNYDKSVVIADVINKVSIEPLDFKTKSFKISYKDKSAVKTRDITNMMVRVFVEYDIEKKREGFENVISFLNVQIGQFEEGNTAFEDSISALRVQFGYMDKNELQTMSSEVSSANMIIRMLTQDILSIKSFKKIFKDTEFSSIPLVALQEKDIDVNDLITRINVLKNERNLVLLDVTPDHPKVRLLDKQIQDFKVELSNNLDNGLVVLEGRLKQFSSESAEKLAKIYGLPQVESDFNRLNKIKDSKDKFYLNLIDQRANYMIANAGVVSDYVILQNATTPNSPISPKVTMIRLAGILSGILLGLLLVIIRYLLHKTIISIQEVQYKSKAPLLGVIPSYEEKLVRSQIVVTKDPKSTISEAYRGIRSNLQFMNNSPGPKVIATTSTIPGEGKTFTGLNLAAIISLLDKKVVIVDCDLRKPRINKIFDCDNSVGVSTILSNQSGEDECIYSSGIKNIDIIPSGPVPPNPSELILSERMDKMVEYLKTKYDYVVIDTPPIGLVTDSLEILRKADFPIYVLRAAYSNRTFIINANKLIDDNKIEKLSVILNDFGRGASSYGYYYGSGSGYGYGYGYSYNYGNQKGYGYYGGSEKKKQSLIQKAITKIFTKA
jgi:tyrosine-protein kinase Etk/Wzc